MFHVVPAFAQGQAETDCPMMRESNRRSNPKLNLQSQQQQKRNQGVKASTR
jgi:hypothetical protein